MSRSNNNGKRIDGGMPGKPTFKNESWTKHKSDTFASTHKIRQRNKPIWNRLLNKQRRQADKEAIRISDDED